jgi:transposase
MDERVKFIARLLDGESMSGLCEEFSISRKTGDKILKRYRDCGVEGLTDRSRRPTVIPASRNWPRARMSSSLAVGHIQDATFMMC